MKFISTNRGARALIYEGYKYQINRRGRDAPKLTTLNGKSLLIEPINRAIQLMIQK